MNALRSIQRSCALTLGNLVHRTQPLFGTRPNDKCAQLLLMLRYREMAQRGLTLPSIAEVGFRVYSQNDEDGILLYLVSIAGSMGRTIVEMCVEDGVECNAANLIVNHGWRGLLFDGSAKNIERAKRFYGRHPDTWLRPPQIVQSWITRENVNDLLIVHGIRGEVDILSIDLDGIDYWIWKRLDALNPRIVVIEYRQQWGSQASVTVPYSDTFDRGRGHPEYWGASLAALVKLGSERGYILVGCDRTKTNAFFMRSDVMPGLIAKADPHECTDYLEPSPGLPTGDSYPWQSV